MSHLARARQPSLLMLCIIVTVSPFTLTVIPPSLADIRVFFGVEMSTFQYFMSMYMLGNGGMQLVHGPLSDRFGRRPVLIASFSLYVVASLLCAWAPTIEWMVVARFLQGVGASAGVVLGRAIIRDIYDEQGALMPMSILTAAMASSTLYGPLLGGFVHETVGWQGNFYVMAGLAVVLVIMMAVQLAETRPDDAPSDLSVGVFFRRCAEPLKNGTFVGYTLAYSFMMAALLTYFNFAPDLFTNQLGLGAAELSYVIFGIGVAYILTSLLAGKLAPRVGENRFIALVLVAALVLTLTSGILTAMQGASLLVLASTLILMNACLGFVAPPSLTKAVSLRPDIAGTASGVISASGTVLSAAVTWLVGQFYDDTAMPVIIAMIGCVLIALIGMVFVRRSV